jgi:hypothetical protein
MLEVFKLLIGLAVLALGIPIGNLLAKHTKEELKDGRKYFNILIILCLIGAIIFIFLRNDAILFTLLFMAIVTSRSLRKR